MQTPTPQSNQWLVMALEVMSGLFILFLGLLALWIVVVFIADISQTRHAIRRNYPVIGRFRYLFEKLGGFFRQYFFAMDREELPFNRAQRTWVYRAAKDLNNTVAFGSTRDIRAPGSVLFVNCPYPTLGENAAPSTPVTIGKDCRSPYTSPSFFNISGMSYGAISRPAVLALSQGAKKAGVWMNTGEGGLTPWHLQGGCDLVFQIGTAKYGVRDADGALDDSKLASIAAHEQVRMFELKLSQGAKPGKGGIVPANKVTREIAEIRGIKEGCASISPNRHPDISNDDDLLNMLAHIREVTGKPVGIKTVIGDKQWLDELFSLIREKGENHAPDFITLDGAEGGTGASPMPLIDAVGMPLKESLPLLVDKLNEYGLRERIKVIASAKLVNPTDVTWALCVGADFIVSARGFMFALGCIQALQCNENTCPTGIATHDQKLQRGLDPELKSERVANYVRNMTYEVGMIAHACGVPSPRGFQRRHARVVQENGLSVPLSELFPPVKSLD
ncbi:FMN-binding glutamate synthase family protein [Thiolapillus sp.]